MSHIENRTKYITKVITMTVEYNLKEIISHFNIKGNYVSVAPCGNGHINDTFAVCMQQENNTKHYLVQHVNQYVFHNVKELMHNMKRATDHIYKKLSKLSGHNPERETRRIISANDGNPFYVDNEGRFWRAFTFIEDAYCLEVVETPHQAYQAARAFGLFQKLLQDLPEPRLFDTIPDFHNTVKRYQAFEDALRIDECERAKLIPEEIKFAKARKNITSKVVDLMAKGVIPERITHNDTKINNVMFDENTEHAICVIDLDTIMPGSVLYDFGDQVRTTTATGEEDERDLSKINFMLEMFESLVHGYLEVAGDFLVDAEIDLLAFSGKLITFEIGLRFLTDYLDGDRYFKTDREHHNLDRCRTQFELVRQIEEQFDKMVAIVEKHKKQIKKQIK